MRVFAFSTFLAVSGASMACAANVAVPTAQGEVSLPAAPQKIAVYDLAALDTLTALGVSAAGVPEKLYVPQLQDLAAKATAVGTLFEPNLEALAGLGPDLVVVGGRSATQKAAVEQIAPAIDMTIGTDLLGDSRARLAAFGKLFEREDKAAELTATLDGKLAAAKAAGEGKGKALIVMTNGPKLAAYGKDSRFGWLHEATGMPEAAEKLGSDNHGNAISHEFIAQTNPDWLFVIDRGAAIGEAGQAAAETLKNPLVEGTTAWKEGHVVYLDSADAYISAGGYTSTVKLLDQLTGALTGK